MTQETYQSNATAEAYRFDFTDSYTGTSSLLRTPNIQHAPDAGKGHNLRNAVNYQTSVTGEPQTNEDWCPLYHVWLNLKIIVAEAVKLSWRYTYPYTGVNGSDGLVQEGRNFIANALELRLSCTNPSMCE